MIGAGEFQIEIFWRVVKRCRRMGSTVTDLEMECLAVGTDVEDWLRQAGTRCVWPVRVCTFVQVEENCAAKAAAFVCDDEIDAGEVVELATPDADKSRYVFTRM